MTTTTALPTVAIATPEFELADLPKVTKAKRLLPGDLYDACCRQNKDSISAVTE